MMRKTLAAVIGLSLIFTFAPVESFAAAKAPAKPKITKAAVYDSNNVKLQWGKTKNAAKYKVYRKKADGKFVLVKTTTKRTYYNKKLAYGTKYTYKVTAISKAGKKNTSKLKTIYTKPAKPVMTAKVQNTNQVKLTWKKVKGAAKYKVYRKKTDGKYVLMKTTTALNYTNKNTAYGTKYTYKVTAVSKDGKVNTSKTKTVTTAAKVPDKPSEDKQTDLDKKVQGVLSLVNKERKKEGLPALQLHVMIEETAQAKAVDMRETGVFNHYSENLGYPWEQYDKIGLRYLAAGENIAWGQDSAEAVMEDWMNSPGHRANILNESFTHIGIGYDSGYWVQQFAGLDPTSTIETCRYCKKQFTADSTNRYTSTDAEGNQYDILQCVHCAKLMEKCPKCDTGYFETVGLTQWGSQAEKCDVCGHQQDATCIDTCPTCDGEIWDKEADKSNTDKVDYTVTFDSTQSYDGKNYNRTDGCYFQQFVVSSNVCKNCGTHVLMDESTICNYQEFYQLLKETLGTEANIFDYIKWEKQVDLIYKGENGGWSEYEIVKEFTETPAITDLAQIVGMPELHVAK